MDTSAQATINIPPPALEGHLHEERLEGHHVYAVDACLVRILKKHKAIKYTSLVSQCAEEICKGPLALRPSSGFLKKRIEQLMEREYLVRAANSPSLLTYLP
ncbi:hypothetical protein L7F22_061078 [Adiantum nelumboides]|nr:hypothetical protein [Adiantum nelumboides]